MKGYAFLKKMYFAQIYSILDAVSICVGKMFYLKIKYMYIYIFEFFNLKVPQSPLI